uniref:hypothetical protein n=1 Tax=Alistipes sp. TaxID=1872444 RepID=UPI0040578AAF
MKPILLIAVFLFGASALQARSTCAESTSQDSLYLATRHQGERLQKQIDSVDLLVGDLRREYRERPDRRDSVRGQILSLEELLMRLRSERAEVAERINLIEHERMARGEELIAEEGNNPGAENPYATGPRMRNLIDNSLFRQLPEEDYQTLQQAQRYERMASENIERYAENYALMLEMHEGLISTTEQGVADSLYQAMQRLEAENDALDELLHESWTYIFDNKGYAYSYLLDMVGDLDLLEQGTERVVLSQQQSEAMQGEYASDALVEYFVQKPALVEWERRIADRFGLVEASDSLRMEAEYLSEVEFRLPHLIYEQRFLLPYAAIEFSATPKYTTRNPIPECEIFEHGTLYRVRLGSYKYKQQPTIFRGAFPLCCNREEGRYVYYAGAFATKIEARLACEQLLQRGFKRPEIVRWVNGVREDVAMDEPEMRYQIEIVGAVSLSEEVREALQRVAPEAELARVGGRFIVRTFDDRSVAEALLLAIRQADPALEVEVVEVKN